MRVVVLFALALSATACLEFNRPTCSADSDCDPGQSCAVEAGACVSALPDSSTADGGDADSAPADGARDMSAPADGARPDAAPSDAASQDSSMPDAAPDSALADGALTDGALPDAGRPDAARPDAGPVPDAGPECVDSCTPCLVDGAQGPCRLGLLICDEAGQQRCVSNWPTGQAQPCDLLDNDCDGATDEDGEVTINHGADVVLFGRCENAGTQGPEGSELCRRGEGLDLCPAQACASDLQRAECDQQRLVREIACEQGDAVADCLMASKAQWLTCLEPANPAGAPWICGEGGGHRCRPTTEICNNGIDEDQDGLIDGSLANPGTCMASITPGAAPFQMGLCADPEEDDACLLEEQRMGVLEQHSEDRADRDESPRMVQLSYNYAVDHEEVSIRSFLQCQRDGCCTGPSGPIWNKVSTWAADQPRLPQRAPDACPAPPTMDSPAPDLLDLPVTGVTWCQARDYCHWAGKRLITEAEWERAATGNGPRQAYAWGDAPPNRCVEDQCCVAPGQSPPAFCGQTAPTCLDAVPAVSREACIGHYPGTEGCEEDTLIPTPVWGNGDGRTPTGIHNLNGNVGEWVFDWFNARYDGQSRVNPAGPACDDSSLPHKRAVRGMPIGRRTTSINNFGREALFPELKSAQLGFRCARTVPDSGDRCSVEMPDTPDTCAPARGVACLQGPDFVDAEGGDALECESSDGPRRSSGQCRDQAGLCSSGQLIDPTGQSNGCDSFVVNELTIQTLEAARFSIDLIDLVMNPSLAPNGGTTLFVIGVPPGFQPGLGEVPIRIGTGFFDFARRLTFAGEFTAPTCHPMPVFEDVLRSIGNEFSPGCNASPMHFKFDGLPINLHLNAMAHAMRYDAQTDGLTGTLQFVMNRESINSSVLGDVGGLAEALWPFLQNPQTGEYADFDLCSHPIPGCNGNLLLDACVNGSCPGHAQEQCRGAVFEVRFKAVRARDAGLPAFNCE